MQTVRLAEDFQFLTTRAPDAVHAAVGMIGAGERDLLFNAARQHFRGEGVIVDAGILLGASTLAFGHGLKARTTRVQQKSPIRSYELGLVNPTLRRFMDAVGVGAGLNVGDSFAPLLKANIAPVAEQVELQVGDVTQATPPSASIEILFLDLLKLPAIADHVLLNYFTRLIPGHSLVLQQDYFIDRLPFIKTLQEAFAVHFEYVGEVDSTAVFKSIAAITREQAAAFVATKPSPEQQLQYAEQATARTTSSARMFMMELSRARLIAQLGHPDVALEAINNLAAFMGSEAATFAVSVDEARAFAHARMGIVERREARSARLAEVEQRRRANADRMAQHRARVAAIEERRKAQTKKQLA